MVTPSGKLPGAHWWAPFTGLAPEGGPNLFAPDVVWQLILLGKQWIAPSGWEWVPVRDSCGEEGTEPEGKALN